MAGLVGSDDNSDGWVGIMPLGPTLSMNISHNRNITNVVCQGPENDDGTFCIEDDDFVAALDYASSNDIEVLGMSFTGQWGASVDQALSDVYQTYDVLLLAVTGNDGSESTWLVSRSSVTGVGGLDSLRNSIHNEAYEDVSAYSGGGTTDASCSGTDFCTDSGYIKLIGDDVPGGGGTSSSTAIAAGIAGLVRDYHSSLSAATIRQRLISTSDNSNGNHVLDAYAAIVNPLVVDINGSTTAPEFAICNWGSDVQGGTTPYSYEWYRDGVLVSTSGSYADQTGSQDFSLRLDVTDNAGTLRSDEILVDVDSAYSAC